MPSRRSVHVFAFSVCFLMISDGEEISFNKVHLYNITVIQINSLLKKRIVLAIKMDMKIKAGVILKEGEATT